MVEDKEAKIPAGERSPQWIRKITVVARFKAKEVSEQKLRNVLLTLIEPSRLDEGRIKYDLHQGINDPTRFIFYEIWESKELLDRHAASSHVQNNIARVKDLLAEPPEVTLLDRIS